EVSNVDAPLKFHPPSPGRLNKNWVVEPGFSPAWPGIRRHRNFSPGTCRAKARRYKHNDGNADGKKTRSVFGPGLHVDRTDRGDDDSSDFDDHRFAVGAQ